MLDRQVINKFMDCKLEGIEIPADVPKEALVEAFY